MSPAVGIVLRTRDRPLLLQRAMESLSAQEYAHWKAVIVNDGGQRRPVEALLAAQPKTIRARLRILHRDNPCGMEAATNAGLEVLRDCPFLALHDDDDSWAPAFLARTVAYLEAHPSEVGVVTGAQVVEEVIASNGPREIARHPFNPWLQKIGRGRLLVENLFPPIMLLFRRSALEQIGLYDESLPVLGDWEFHLRLAGFGPIGYLTEPLAHYHLRPRQLEGPYGNSIGSGEGRHRLYDALLRNRWLREDIARNQPEDGWKAILGRLDLALARATGLSPALDG